MDTLRPPVAPASGTRRMELVEASTEHMCSIRALPVVTQSGHCRARAEGPAAGESQKSSNGSIQRYFPKIAWSFQFAWGRGAKEVINAGAVRACKGSRRVGPS